MASNNIVDLRSDALSIIFNFMIFDLGQFHMFARLLFSWLTKRTTSRVKHVLEKLDWDSLYQFHQHDFEVTRDAFHGFIRFAVRYQVDQAMFYNSTRNLFLMKSVHHHMLVLSSLSGKHLPSAFSLIFFKAIYRPFDISETAQEMFKLFNTTHLRGRLIEQMALLQDMFNYISEKDYLLPVYKFCPNARNPDPIYQIYGHPLGEELWYSLCDRTVEENYRNEDELYGKRLTMQHIWGSDCEHCRLQLIVFKILLSSVSD